MARNINRKLLLSDGAKASLAEDVLSISGSKGELSLNVHNSISFEMKVYSSEKTFNWFELKATFTFSG